MDEDIEIKHEGIAAVIEAARAARRAEIVDAAAHLELDGLEAVPVALLPGEDGSVTVESLKGEIDAWQRDYATRPRRRRGTARLDELASFVDHANRFKDHDSAIFVSGGAASPTFTSVIDYHKQGAIETASPRFGEHRGVYSPAFSPEWKVWTAANGQNLTQAQFANLINTCVRDVLDVDGLPDGRLGEAPVWFAARFGGKRDVGEFYASAERLLALAEGLTITVQDKVGDVSRRDSGETRITFESERSTDIEIPVAFVLELPVFLGGDLYQIPVRLRFTVRQEGDTKRAQWRIELFGSERTVLAVVAEMREQIAKGTGLPVFAGSPE